MESPGSPSVTCEVCEAVQPPATLCAECGMALHLPEGVVPAADPPIERLPDLEVTVSAPVGDVESGILPELEPTIAEATPDIGVASLPDFESTVQGTAAPPGGGDDLPGVEEDLPSVEDDLPVAEEEVPDIEQAVQEFERLPPMEEGIPDQCPWCGFAKSSGRMCNNCGRSKIRILPSTDFASILLVPLDEDDQARVRCRGCGAMMKPGARCTDCGQPLPAQEM